jgi:calcium-dependent protein kinase
MLSIQDYKELRQIFESVDQNGDGTLSREEIKGQLANCLPASTLDHRLDEIFQKVDSDHNGHIDYEEFIKATIDVAKVESKEVLRRTFQMFDKDSNGYISCEELKLVLETAELDDGMDWSALLKEADTNGDGVIDMMEFEALIQRKI